MKIDDLKVNKAYHALPQWLEAVVAISHALELHKMSQSRCFSFGASLLLAAHKRLGKI